MGTSLSKGTYCSLEVAQESGRRTCTKLKMAPCVYAGYLIKFRAMSNIALPEFLGLWTHSEGYHRWVVSMFGRRRSTQHKCSGVFVDACIPLPTPDEQRTIAASLGSMRDTIVHGQTQADALRSLKASAADALLAGTGCA